MRFSYRAAGPIAAASILVLLAACSRTQQDWRVAQQAGTSQSYEVFAQRHPDSELAGVARQRVAQLVEEAAWQQATRLNTPAAYQQYLAKYPTGSWSQDARIRMESRSMAAPPLPDTAPPATPAGAEPAPAPPSAASQPAPGAAAAHPDAGLSGPAMPPATVQLGAFSTIANVDSAWTQLSSRFKPELQGLSPQIEPVMSSGRRLYRLEIRVANEAAARQLCRQLQQHSQGCLAVP